jgi:hypothetical protein
LPCVAKPAGAPIRIFISAGLIFVKTFPNCMHLFIRFPYSTDWESEYESNLEKDQQSYAPDRPLQRSEV